MKINNRRYIGSKTKLVDIIYQSIISTGINSDFTFADLFAGTGIVAYYMALNNHKTIVNDTLYSNYVAYKAWMGDGPYDQKLINVELDYFNNMKYSDIHDNYFSVVYGNKYFSINDARKIGYIRDKIEEKKSTYTEREFYIILSSLLYATDKIANTVGHFEHFLKKEPQDSNFQLSMLDFDPIMAADIYNEDSNVLAKKISADVVYIDPPYNARQYINFYHVLENLARWNKPTEFEGSSMKFKRNELKSGYSRSIANQLLRDLVQSLKTKLIVVSYNNTYNAKSGASNNKISEEELISILEEKGDVEVKSFDYHYFNTGKTTFDGHQEKLYLCKVRR